MRQPTMLAMSSAVGLLLAASGPITVAGPAATAADPARGQAIYARCAACHSLNRNRTGPRHCGLIGRRAGSVPGFEYSAAMRAAGIVWTQSTLDRFLAAPMRVVPGTTMGYAGIGDEQDRRDLISYLEWAGRHAPQCTALASESAQRPSLPGHAAR